MKKTLLSRVALISLSLFLAKALAAQNVGINDDNSVPDPNAMLDVKSTSKGVLFPRLTTAQRTTLGTANPTEGMLVFDIEVEAFFYFINGDWVQLSSGANNSVPVGTILPYAGHIDEAYDGELKVIAGAYLLCNGAIINSATGPYVALANILNQYWGDNDEMPNTVNLPDLRAMFLRGVNGKRGDDKTDPNAGDRGWMLTNGTGTANHVGSYQQDALQDHFHGYYRNDTTIDRGTSGGQASVLRGVELANSFGPSGRVSTETRPQNAYVHYIIKY